MFKIIFLAFFTTLLFGNNFIPNEQCSYEGDKFWIKILYLCVKGDVGCEKMLYVGVNKTNGESIVLRGKTLLDGNYNFKGYGFKNGAYNMRFLEIIHCIFQKVKQYCKK